MPETKASKDTITIKKREIPVEKCLLNQNKLLYYSQNPRIYSIVCQEKEEPTQEEIESKLKTMDHVKQLVQSIKANGGLIDPLIIQKIKGQYVVIEGNSRLAAYRLLAEKNIEKWSLVKCNMLPDFISEEEVFALLGEYHIIGRKDWAPFEQAGYLWRRTKNYNISADRMATEMGLSSIKVNHFINVYNFMVTHDEVDAQLWSYYDVLFASNKIKKAINVRPELPEIIVKKRKCGEIPRADDVRKKVQKIVETGGKTLKKFLSTDNSLENCYENALAKGADNAVAKRLKKFQEFISDPDTRKELVNMKLELSKKCQYQLRKINKITNTLLKEIDQK